MQRGPEHFGDQELALIYIAKRLTEALRLENLLTEAGLDYLVEPDKYSGGIIFQIGTGRSILLRRAERRRRRQGYARTEWVPAVQRGVSPSWW